MTVKELIKELKTFPKDAEVYFVNDWDAVEDGKLTDISPVFEVTSQTILIDMGIDWDEETQVLICKE